MRSHSRLAELAERQYGVVSFRQLRELEFSKGHVYRACEADRLRRVHRGVYAVGHSELSPHGRCRAALLAFNDNAVLSHRSAAWLRGLLASCPSEVDVIVPGKGLRRGIRVHRVAAIGERDCGTVDRIPVTSLARTWSIWPPPSRSASWSEPTGRGGAVYSISRRSTSFSGDAVPSREPDSCSGPLRSTESR